MESEKVLTLKLVIDKEKNHLVFAESDGDFVDILFSFLTLPIGAIVRLLDKKSSLGCMDKLYEVVENLGENHFHNQICKSMLLFPRSAAEDFWKKLKIKVDDTEPLPWYGCSRRDTSVPRYHNGRISGYITSHLYSLVPGVCCNCGYSVQEKTSWSPSMSDCGTEDGAFIKHRASLPFIITDDLRVMPASTAAYLSLLQKFGVVDASLLERRLVQFGRDEVLSLLKSCLSSRVALSEVFLGKQPSPRASEIIAHEIKVESNDSLKPEKIEVKILFVKTENQLVYVEAGEDFVDFIFSFLTLPLGSIMRLLNNSASIGSLNNLYKSIEILDDHCFSSEDHKLMLLNPKLALHFDISNQILSVASDFLKLDMAVNPKLADAVTQRGGGFLKKLNKYMVSKELNVAPFSAFTGVNLVSELKIPIAKLGEGVIEVGEAEALSLLKYIFISEDPLGEYYAATNVN